MSNFPASTGGATRQVLKVGMIVIVGVLVGGACSGKSTSASSRSTTTTSSTTTATSTTVLATTSTTAVAAPVTTAPPATSIPIAAQPVMCTTGQLTISLVGAQGGLSHAGYIILFKNTGNPCQIHGYPGLDGVNSDGVVVVSAQRTPNGMLGGLPNGVTAEPNVDLTTGQTASAIFEGIDGPVASLGPCAQYTVLVITPPNETHSVRIASPDPTDPICYPQVHPVVAGSTGGANT